MRATKKFSLQLYRVGDIEDGIRDGEKEREKKKKREKKKQKREREKKKNVPDSQQRV